MARRPTSGEVRGAVGNEIGAGLCGSTSTVLLACLATDTACARVCVWHSLTGVEELVASSGKLAVLDRLLAKLQSKGHRVVLFSMFTSMLDILEDVIRLRGYRYCRLDGSTNRVQRNVNIASFNAKDSPYFIFLMSTKAGGLGVNLQSADTAILYDSDWNPQGDLQAMARVHRIGQEKKVHVYRMVTRGTVEERIIQRAEKKLYLDQMVNRGSTAQAERMEALGTDAILKMLRFGADKIMSADGTEELALSDKDLERLIDRTETAVTKNVADHKPEDDKAASFVSEDELDADGVFDQALAAAELGAETKAKKLPAQTRPRRQTRAQKQREEKHRQEKEAEERERRASDVNFETGTTQSAATFSAEMPLMQVRHAPFLVLCLSTSYSIATVRAVADANAEREDHLCR